MRSILPLEKTSCLLLLIFTTLPAWGADWNAVEAGAKPDGQTDCTEVIQRLLDQAGASGGGTVYLPAGQYRVEGNLSLPAAVTLKGVFNVPPTTRHEGSPDLHGTVLLAFAGRGSREGRPFIHLAGHMAVLSGVIVHYPEWRQTDVPPVPYPPCVLADGAEDVGVFDCCLINPYEAVVMVRSARHVIRNVFGYPSFRGLYVDECYDIGRIENCHFWPFGVNYQVEDPFCKWVNTEGVAFEFARTDWHYVLNTFCFGYGVGYKYSESKAGSCNGNFLGIGADSCVRPVLVEQAQDPGLLITNGEFVGRWGSRDSVGVEVTDTARGKVSLVNCSFWGPIDRCIHHHAPWGQLTASACNFVHWDNTGIGSPCIRIDSGAAIVQGNTFSEGSLHVLVAEPVRSAILMGNQAASGFRVENHAGKKTQAVANEEDSIGWNEEARKHYTLRLGAKGDSRYLRHWFGPEGKETDLAPNSTWRWTTASSTLVLPVNPNKPYELTLASEVPAEAVEPQSGIYLGEKRLAEFAPGGNELRAKIPPQDSETLTLTLRVREWVPSQHRAESQDHRGLGIQVYRVTLKADDAPEQVFNANRGEWTP